MPGKSFRIARIAGIPVGVSPWWLAIVALITWSLGANYFPEVVHGIAPGASYALGLASALLLFASILVHEFGHALVARRHGIQVDEIDLWLLGGVSIMHGDAHDPGTELRYALAGPMVTAVIAALFGAIDLLLPASTPEVLSALIEYQLLINCMILGFNLLPAFPLDGGRVLRALLWRRSGDMGRATETAANIGRGFGYLLIGLGVLEVASGFAQGLWLAVIGFFLVGAARAQSVSAQVRTVFAGVEANSLMSSPVVTIPAETSIERAVRDYFVPYRYTAFPAVDAQGRLVGLLTLARLQAVPAEQRPRLRVDELADRDPQLKIGEQEDVSELLERPAFSRVGRAVVLDLRGAPVGLLSITDVERSMRAFRLSHRPNAPGAPHPDQSAAR
jgi:Zn-dependent protease/predicted transcriptional regulator